MPFKHNTARRHRIVNMKFKVTNWPDYGTGPRRRGSLTLGLVFGLRLRQIDRLLISVPKLMGLDLPVPDHTT